MKRLWLLYLILIFGLSSIPAGSKMPRAPVLLDKLAHLVIYAGFGVVYVGFGGHERRSRRATLLAAVGLVAAVGLADELYQGLIPGRSQEFADWLADLAGGTCGALAMLYLRRHGSGQEGRKSA